MKLIRHNLIIISDYDYYNIKDLKIGTATELELFIKKDEDFYMVIEVGTQVTEELYAEITGYKYIYILKKEIANKAIAHDNLRDLIDENRDDLKKIIDILYEFNNQIFDNFLSSKENKIDLESVKSIVKSTIFLIKDKQEFIRDIMPYLSVGDKLSNHSLHVAMYTIKLAALLDFDDNNLIRIGTAALLHDVGYKNISNDTLNKTTRLSDKETQQIHQHSQYSINILLQNGIDDLLIIDGVLHHHERYDGSGYPRRFKKDRISNFASILGICDVFDALTNSRPHRKEFKTFDALNMMLKDPSMVNKFNIKYLLLAIKSL
ncbi:HD domain-containing phosphohydrolase [Sulfurimonas sp.]|uniref:HD-GYP domain-containing protein n=1 Tax=Sulfurimonas sp. TaxID=2022749 RepID=UPI0025CD5D50|nr:HD domain-containing phosphohydrolase [Sulfurimonas sp.]MDD5156798.1 HD domain-containing protein [Sulfurimonas sp.]